LIEASNRQEAVRLGVRLEVVTVVWMAAEAVLAIGAGTVSYTHLTLPTICSV